MAEDRFRAQGRGPAMPGIGEALPFFARRMLAAARTPASMHIKWKEESNG